MSISAPRTIQYPPAGPSTFPRFHLSSDLIFIIFTIPLFRTLAISLKYFQFRVINFSFPAPIIHHQYAHPMFASYSSVGAGPSQSNLPYGHNTDGRTIGTDYVLPPLPSQIHPFIFVQQGMPLPMHTYYDYGGRGRNLKYLCVFVESQLSVIGLSMFLAGLSDAFFSKLFNDEEIC